MIMQDIIKPVNPIKFGDKVKFVNDSKNNY